MELDITKFFREACASDYSASRLEKGDSAGADTWRAACDDWEEYTILDSVEKDEAFRRYVRGFGAWSDEEIASWDDRELNALCLQMIAGDIRDAGLDTENPDWVQYMRDSNAGRVSGRIYKGDDGATYYYIGE